MSRLLLIALLILSQLLPSVAAGMAHLCEHPGPERSHERSHVATRADAPDCHDAAAAEQAVDERRCGCGDDCSLGSPCLVADRVLLAVVIDEAINPDPRTVPVPPGMRTPPGKPPRA